MTDDDIEAIRIRMDDIGLFLSVDQLKALKVDVQRLVSEAESARRSAAWFPFIRDFAARTMPHATGQGHLALMSVRSFAMQAMSGDERPER